KVEQRVNLPKLPAYVDWDTNPLANDRYILRLVAVDERTQTEVVMDEVDGKVDNPSKAPEPAPTPVKAISADPQIPAPAPDLPPSPQVARRSGNSLISGSLSLPIMEWPTDTPGHYLPVVDVYRDGKRVDSQGTGGRFPFVLQWDTTATPNAVYTLK